MLVKPGLGVAGQFSGTASVGLVSVFHSLVIISVITHSESLESTLVGPTSLCLMDNAGGGLQTGLD